MPDYGGWPNDIEPIETAKEIVGLIREARCRTADESRAIFEEVTRAWNKNLKARVEELVREMLSRDRG